MPRILGQKKLREDSEADSGDSLALHNSITAQELFTRHSNLASFLIQNLENCSTTLNPSLVPILSMLSRVSPGLQMSSDQDLQNEMGRFKTLFLSYLNHQEFMVRKLAAKTLIGFTAKVNLIDTLNMILHLINHNVGHTNFQHGGLLSLLYGIRLLKTEYQADLLKIHRDVLISSISSVKVSCPFNQLILEDLKSLLHITTDVLNYNEDFHPGNSILTRFPLKSSALIIECVKFCCRRYVCRSYHQTF